MIALANPVTVPFFERIPPRAIAVVHRAVERIRHQELYAQPTEFSHNLFCRELRDVDVAGPTFDEFAAWVREVQAAPAGSDADLPSDLPSAGAKACTAFAIVAMAVRLQQAMIEDGYSPDSVEMENQIVAEAIKEWLAAEAEGWGAAMNLPYSPGEMALHLVSSKDSEQNAKLLDVLSTHMQRELALAIVNIRAKGEVA